jgi:predicted permease
LTHNGIDIDQFILLTIYPTITFFIIGLVAKRLALGEPLKNASLASGCIVFGIIYFLAIPNGGAQGLAAVLILFGAILFLMARKYIMHPREGEENPVQSKEEIGRDETEKTSTASFSNETSHGQ